MRTFNKTVKFIKDLSDIHSLSRSECLIIYDQVLSQNLEVNAWLKKFSKTYGVEAGENLKELTSFSNHFEKIAKILAGTSRKIKIVAMGGGSVTDFAGFFASTYKRGVKLVLVPSTWLAAIDSAHGGKNGLNAGSLKNAMGTFYFPEKIYLVKSVLKAQPRERQAEAYGELLKIALISGKPWVNKVLEGKELKLWRLLPLAVKAKYDVIAKDPYEEKGVRQILNLGHTLGHIIEKKNSLPHGVAVGHGIVFASRWSEKRGLLKGENQKKIEALIKKFQNSKNKLKPLTKVDLEDGLRGDKKINLRGKIDFVFLRKPGKVFLEEVSIADLTDEAIAQGWAKV
ncbi:MAG: hypothetical protein A4S09_01125 [Proteobacteria bacterium SG_bin7]|nr:MAG: hypothetical protein A4S09_01125 [Proteobacteria bacterium SG_bin7]